MTLAAAGNLASTPQGRGHDPVWDTQNVSATHSSRASHGRSIEDATHLTPFHPSHPRKFIIDLLIFFNALARAIWARINSKRPTQIDAKPQRCKSNPGVAHVSVSLDLPDLTLKNLIVTLSSAQGSTPNKNGPSPSVLFPSLANKRRTHRIICNPLAAATGLRS